MNRQFVKALLSSISLCGVSLFGQTIALQTPPPGSVSVTSRYVSDTQGLGACRK